MKAKIVIFILLLSASQAFASEHRNREALVGFIGGVVVASLFYTQHNKTSLHYTPQGIKYRYHNGNRQYASTHRYHSGQRTKVFFPDRGGKGRNHTSPGRLHQRF
jgi:hypothetical protein